jgi:hypothetical protein
MRRRVRPLRKVAIVAFVALMAMTLALPGAKASAVGATVFNCKVTLPVWPTSAGPAVDCNGKTSGVIEGKTTANKQYVIAPANAAFSAHATFYKEVCTGGEPINGSAAGTFSAPSVKSVSPAGTASISGIQFVWTRIGATALVNLRGGTISFSNGSIATGNVGNSVAAFAPNKLGTCTKPAINEVATIVGVAVFH